MTRHRVHVYQNLLDLLPIAVQNALVTVNVQTNLHALIQNVRILAQAHAEQIQNAMWLATRQCVFAQWVILVIHLRNVHLNNLT